MGLIKKDQIKDTGTRLADRKFDAPKVNRPVSGLSYVPAVNLDKSREDADLIIRQAEEEAESIRSQAVEDGKREGKAEAAAKIREALTLINDAVKEKKKILEDAGPEILRLAIKVAEQIIRSEVSLHRDVCLNIVAEAIARVSDREQIIVRVNREDSEFLKKYKDRLAGILDGVRSFSILEDQTVEPGGCVIETSLGFIDARIGTKLKSIEEALQKEAVSISEETVTAAPSKTQPLADAPLPPAPAKSVPENDELFDDFADDDLMLDDFDDKL